MEHHAPSTATVSSSPVYSRWFWLAVLLGFLVGVVGGFVLLLVVMAMISYPG